MLKSSGIPALRVRRANEAAVRPEGDFVLYWMIANRRHDYNYSLQRAVEWAKELGKPLVVLEALRVGCQWASDRIHGFVIDGMADNFKRFDKRGVTYLPYLERKAGEGRGLLEALAKHAAVVVTDDFPCFFLPRMVEAAATRLGVLLESIDSNGVLPMRAADKEFARAYDFRRFLQRTLPDHIFDFPKADPLRGNALPRLQQLPKTVTRQWRFAEADTLRDPQLSEFEIDHSVPRAGPRGGIAAGGKRLSKFLKERLSTYHEGRNLIENCAASGLSPYLHFGHISAHRAFRELAALEDWNPNVLEPTSAGKREGWWQMPPGAESFLDELITWREVGFNKCQVNPKYDKFESLPRWVLENFRLTAADGREHVYSLEQFESAKSHDPIWNAAQRELVQTGSMHNYLRMLWGKKILEWTRAPQDALAVMVELNNKYALDGRNPNSYSGIFWVLGGYDRPWGPVRPIFGKVRYMSSDNTRKKLKLGTYLKRFGGAPQAPLPGVA